MAPFPRPPVPAAGAGSFTAVRVFVRAVAREAPGRGLQ